MLSHLRNLQRNKRQNALTTIFLILFKRLNIKCISYLTELKLLDVFFGENELVIFPSLTIFFVLWFQFNGKAFGDLIYINGKLSVNVFGGPQTKQKRTHKA